MKKVKFACIGAIVILALVYGVLVANRMHSVNDALETTGTSSPIIEQMTEHIDSEATYAAVLMDKLGLPAEQADARAAQVFSQMDTDGNGSGAGTISLYIFNRVVYPDRSCKENGWSAEYGFSATVTDDGSPVFVDIIDTWQTASESGVYTYEAVSTVSANKLNDTQVQLSGLGKLQSDHAPSTSSGTVDQYRIDANINTVVEISQIAE